LVFFSIFDIGAALPVEISVQTPSLIIGKGQEFNVNISINPVNNPISGGQFNLVFNSSLATIKNVSEDTLFKINGAKPCSIPGY